MTHPEDAFFTLHRDLPREGPGEPADVAWAANVAGLGPDARIADVGCGPGGDIAALLDAAPRGHVTALDKTAHFIASARRAWGDDPRVTVLQADMARIMNPHDMIWCAGAVYFLGIGAALKGWRRSLARGGVVVFSEPCWFTNEPSVQAREFWAQYPRMTDEAGITRQVKEAGYQVMGSRRLGSAAWEAYYTPLMQRIAALRPQADATLAALLDETEAEVDLWRREGGDFGYLLTVARPA